jgi:hypothetical protein
MLLGMSSSSSKMPILSNFSVTELRAQSLARESRGGGWGCISFFAKNFVLQSESAKEKPNSQFGFSYLILG